jgi:hypothetical protein
MISTSETPKPMTGGLNFAGIKKKSETTTKRKEYPSVADADGTVASLVAVIIECDAAKERGDAAKKMLGEIAAPQFFQHWHGRPEQESSMKARSEKGNALVTFRKQLKKIDSMAALDSLKPVFRGQESEFFRERFVIEIDGDKIPLQAQQALVDKLQALFAEHGALDALGVKTEVKPLEGFHSQRHTLFTPEQNIQINAVIPIVASVKTKGVA